MCELGGRSRAVTYAVEPFGAISTEVQPLWRKHWLTSGVDRDKIALDPDFAFYHALDAAKLLHIVTVRRRGVLIGYFFSILTPSNPHYRHLKQAHADIYFVDCDDAPMARLARYRGLLRRVAAELAALGVQKLLAPVKLHADLGPMFERLGWKPVERVYYTLLGG